MSTATRYSEAFKKNIVEEISRGKHSSAHAAARAYGIRGRGTVIRWLEKYGRDDLLPKRVRIETMEEKNELKEARKRIRKLETALADANIDNLLEHAFLEVACERMDTTLDEFKKKHELTLSDVRRRLDRK